MKQATTFEEATVLSKTLTKLPSNQNLLALYAHFKQATEGDVSGEKPGMFDLKGAAKYKAWEAIKGTSAADAKTAYISLVNQLLSAS